ncbi:MAG: site-2 protease family protein [Patescibacteria group bacterium]
MNILIFLIILLVLVLVHEFGHFFSAKKFGIRVDEFGFGFPPKLFGKKYGETEYSFNLLPIGGFVKIFGENPDEENMNGPDASKSFVNKPKWQQAIVLFAGVFANFILAWLLFSAGFMSGFPTSVGSGIGSDILTDVNLVIVSVLPESPAELAGLKSGDKIVFIKKGDLTTTDISPETVKSFVAGGGEIEIGYLRGKNTTENYLKITPNESGDGKQLIGIAMDQIGVARLPFLSAFYEGMRLTLSMVKGTVLGLYGLMSNGLRGKGTLDSVTGPVGMVGIVGDAYDLGFVYLLSFAGLISINLAIINLIPFPALDGGRLFFLLIEKIKGSRMNPKVANTANMIGFGILILLMLVITWHDIVKLL